jgi:hypothetical protein
MTIQIHPTVETAQEVAELLQVDVFYLGKALRDEAVAAFHEAASRARGMDDESVDAITERGHRLLGAAQACDEAWQLEDEEVKE